MASSLPTSDETGLGEVENADIIAAVVQQSGKRKKPQCKYSDADRYKIAKYAVDNGGASRAANHFKSDFPTIRESTVRGFVLKYKEKMASVRAEKRIPCEPRGRPVMVGNLVEEKVRQFLMALHLKGGHVSYEIAATTAKVFISNSGIESIQNLNITGNNWGRSFLRRMGFKRRVVTTGKVRVPEGAKREAGLQHHYRIVSLVEKYNIPTELILNSDETPSKYVTVGRTTMAPSGSKRVAKAGNDDKRTITLTLTVTMSGRVLPFQIIYGGKTARSIPKVIFPKGFSLSANPSHYSNTEEVCKHLKEIVIPYVNEVRERLNNPDQYALLIWDVFRGQTTDEVSSLLTVNKIMYEFVPNNMTADFQVLDLTVNGWLKDLMKAKFNDWFAQQLRVQLENGTALENIDIKFLLSTMKPLHAGWLISCYDKLSSSEGKKIILSGWRAAGITEAIDMGVEGFNPVIDPFHDVDPFNGNHVDFIITSQLNPISKEYADIDRYEEVEDDDALHPDDGDVQDSSDDPE